MAIDPKKLQQVNQLLTLIQKKFDSLGEDNPFASFDPKNIKDADDAIKILRSGLNDVESKIKNINSTFGDLQETLQNITKEINPKQFNATKGLEKGLRGLVSQANKLANEEAGINTLSKKQLETIKERALASQKIAKDNAAALLKDMDIKVKDGKIGKEGFETIKSMGKEERMQAIAALGILKDRGNFQQNLINGIEKRIELEDQFNKKLGFGGQLAKGLDSALQKAGLPSLGIAESIEEAREKFVETNGEASVFFETLKGVGGRLKDAFSFANLTQLSIGALVGSVITLDKASGEFAKNNGIAYRESLAIRGEMNEIAKSSEDIMVSSKALMETQGSLNSFFGQSVVFTGQIAEDMTSIAQRTNLSKETQGLLALESLRTGKSAKDILKSQQLQVMESNKQLGLQLSVKQVQDAIGDSSKALQLTFKGNSKELINQVAQAKALGANLEIVEGISSSLLEFESSIQAELEAELLLGKEINLEKARQAALQGDLGKVAEEVMKNTAIMNAFENDNVIQQEAAAKALGMTREQLAEMIHEQEKLEVIREAGFEDMNSLQKKYNEDRARGLSVEEASANIKDQDLLKQLETVSAAERFEAVAIRIQEVFVSIAEPILGIVDSIMSAVGGAENLATIVAGMAITYGVIQTILATQAGLETFILAKKLAQEGADKKSLITGKSKLATLVAQAVAFVIANPIAGIIGLGIAAGVAIAVKKNSQMADGIIGPGGEMVVSGPKGSIQLDKDDSIIAGTDLMGGSNGRGNGGGGSNNLALMKKIDQLIEINRQILAKSPVIEMSGNKVGQGINVAERAIQ